MNPVERRARQRASEKRYDAKQRERVMEKFGRRCAHCGFGDVRALQIDHVEGGGIHDRGRRRTGRWSTYLKRVADDTTGKYQLLCANCNWIKRAEREEWRPVSHAP